MAIITVQTTIRADIRRVWEAWTSPEHVINWCFASDDWEAPEAENDLKIGGKFRTRMAAKDGSAAFDFVGVYSALVTHKLIEYDIEDGRHVKIEFNVTGDDVTIVETFEAESTHSEAQQRDGWLAILKNFSKYMEGKND